VGRGELGCYSSSEFQAVFVPHKQLPGLLSMKDREWFIGSGGACLVKFIWRSWSPWCGGGERMFLQLVKHLWSKFFSSASPPKSVHLHDRAEVTHSAHLSNTIPSSRLLCVCNCVSVLQRKCALCTSRSLFSSHFLVDERKMLRYCWWWKFTFCVVHYGPWANFKGLVTCILRVFTD